MKIKKELIKREIAGDVILVPVGKTALENNGLFMLNGVAGFLWDILPEAENEEALVTRLFWEYEVDEKTARADVSAFLDKLKKMEIL